MKPDRARPGAAWSARQETLFRTHHAVMRRENRAKALPDPSGRPRPDRLASAHISQAEPGLPLHGRTRAVALRATNARNAMYRRSFRMRNCFCHRHPVQSGSWRDLPARRPPRPLRPRRPEPRQQPGHLLVQQLRSPPRGRLKSPPRGPPKGPPRGPFRRQLRRRPMKRPGNPLRHPLGLCQKTSGRSRAARARASTENR